MRMLMMRIGIMCVRVNECFVPVLVGVRCSRSNGLIVCMTMVVIITIVRVFVIMR